MKTIFFRLYFFLFLQACGLPAFSQHDSMEVTHHIITDNLLEKNRFWGNSWYFAGGYTKSRYHELDVNIGRNLGSTFCSGAGCLTSTRSIGLGYAYQFNKNAYHHAAKAFWEAAVSYLYVGLGVRMEYQYNLSDNSHYLRPHFGFSFIHFDIMYNYTIPLQKGNPYKHGINLRIKIFHRKDNWELSYPDGC